MLTVIVLIIGALFVLALRIGLKKKRDTEIGGIMGWPPDTPVETQWVNGIGTLKACDKVYQDNYAQVEKIFDEVAELEEANKYYGLNPFNRAHICEECLDVIVACKTYLECNFNQGEISNMIEFVNDKNKKRKYY